MYFAAIASQVFLDNLVCKISTTPIVPASAVIAHALIWHVLTFHLCWRIYLGGGNTPIFSGGIALGSGIRCVCKVNSFECYEDLATGL